MWTKLDNKIELYPSNVRERVQTFERKEPIGESNWVPSSRWTFIIPTPSLSSIPNLKYSKKKSNPPPISIPKSGDIIQLDYNEKKDEIIVSVKKKKPAISSKKKETED